MLTAMRRASSRVSSSPVARRALVRVEQRRAQQARGAIRIPRGGQVGSDHREQHRPQARPASLLGVSHLLGGRRRANDPHAWVATKRSLGIVLIRRCRGSTNQTNAECASLAGIHAMAARRRVAIHEASHACACQRPTHEASSFGNCSRPRQRGRMFRHWVQSGGKSREHIRYQKYPCI